MSVEADSARAQAGGRSGRKAKGSGHLRRAEILIAAERIFVECGYEGATIRRIADEVGVSSTALYMHFRDKSEILIEICEGAFAQLLVKNSELMTRDMDPVGRVRAMLEVYMGFAIQHPHAYLLVFNPSSASRQDKEAALESLGLKTFAIFKAAVSRAAEAGRLKSDDANEVAQVGWAAAHGIVSLMLTQPSFPWLGGDRLMQASMDALFDGVAR